MTKKKEGSHGREIKATRGKPVGLGAGVDHRKVSGKTVGDAATEKAQHTGKYHGGMGGRHDKVTEETPSPPVPPAHGAGRPGHTEGS